MDQGEHERRAEYPGQRAERDVRAALHHRDIGGDAGADGQQPPDLTAGHVQD